MNESEVKPSLSLPLLAAIAVASLAVGIWLSQSYFNKALPQGLEATVLETPRAIRPFKLINHHNQPFTEQSLKGQWSFMFFGFTNCPDICPSTLTVMKSVWQKLAMEKSDPNYPRLFFVSVDPDRDKIENLKKYVTYFEPSFVGVTGSLDEIDNLTGQLGILYGYDDKNSDNENYSVNHSAQLLLIDPQGRMRAVISPPHDSTTIAKNYQIITQYYGS